MLVRDSTRRVAILGGVRTPFARAHTAYAGTDNQELLTAALRALVERFACRASGWAMSSPARSSSTRRIST